MDIDVHIPVLFDDEIVDAEIDAIFSEAQAEQPLVEIRVEPPLVEIRDDTFVFNFDSTTMQRDLEGLISSLQSIEKSADHWRTRALRAESELRLRRFLGGRHG